MKKKSLLNRFCLGIKQGWNTPISPEKVQNFNNNPLIIIFRVIGGLCVIAVLFKKHLLLYFPL